MPEQRLLTKEPARSSAPPRVEDTGRPPPAARRHRAFRGIARSAAPWAVPSLCLLVWQWTSATGVLPVSVLPAPEAVFRTARDLAESGELAHHILASLRRIALGFTLGTATGLLIGFLVGMSRIAEALFDRSLQMVRTIPHLAVVPLMIAWFGIGEEPKVLLVAMGTLFPVYLNTVTGIRGVDPKLLQLGRAYGLGRWRLVRDVAVPGAMPTTLSGIRYALGVAWLTLVVAETISASDGIGHLAQDAREQLRTDQIVLAVLLYALAGLLADTLTRLVERRVLRWHPNYRRAHR